MGASPQLFANVAEHAIDGLRRALRRIKGVQNPSNSGLLVDLVFYEEVGGELSGGKIPDGGVAVTSESDDGFGGSVSGVAESGTRPFPVETEGLVDGAGAGVIWKTSLKKGRKPFGNVTL